MTRCRECLYYYRGKCYSDDVYNVDGDLKACEDYHDKMADCCSKCIWCIFRHDTGFECHKKLTRNRRVGAVAGCHNYKPARYDALLDARLSAPRLCAKGRMA